MHDPRNDIETLKRWIAESDAKVKQLEDEQYAEELFNEGLKAKLKYLMAQAGLSEESAPLTVAHKNGDHPDDPMSIPVRIAGILEARGVPLRATEIVEELEAQGVRTKAARGLLPGVLSALSRNPDRFQRVVRGVYRLNTSGDTG